MADADDQQRQKVHRVCLSFAASKVSEESKLVCELRTTRIRSKFREFESMASDLQPTPISTTDTNVITIVINEQPHQVASDTNLQQIISQFTLPDMGCVFAINNHVVPRSEWGNTCLSQGDSISLFQAIAGG